MSANAAAAVNRAPFGFFKGILVVFLFSDKINKWESAKACVSAGCSAGLEAVTETGERQRTHIHDLKTFESAFPRRTLVRWKNNPQVDKRRPLLPLFETLLTEQILYVSTEFVLTNKDWYSFNVETNNCMYWWIIEKNITGDATASAQTQIIGINVDNNVQWKVYINYIANYGISKGVLAVLSLHNEWPSNVLNFSNTPPTTASRMLLYIVDYLSHICTSHMLLYKLWITYHTSYCTNCGLLITHMYITHATVQIVDYLSHICTSHMLLYKLWITYHTYVHHTCYCTNCGLLITHMYSLSLVSLWRSVVGRRPFPFVSTFVCLTHMYITHYSNRQSLLSSIPRFNAILYHCFIF